MASPLLRRVFAPVVELREKESTTAVLMFAYSFLAMTAYNIIQPITRSKFISDLGAANLPYVTFVSGLLIGVIMQGYVKGTSLLPRRWVIPISQMTLVGILVAFWLLFQTGQAWVSAAFYLLGLIFAILLVSQFWTLANAIYDPRQAKRIFGFIGGGAVLGGATGAGITALIAETVGTNNLLLISASILALCVVIVIIVQGRERVIVAGAGVEDEKGLGAREAIRLFVSSRQIQLIAVIIACGAFGGTILDLQLSMATEAFKGRGATDSITAFLGAVRFWVSMAGFVIQMFLTSRIHRLLGILFALMVLPIGLAAMAGVILANYALWAPALAGVLDRSFRYTVDKTTREILFLPLPSDVKLQAKPFIDVTVDRLAKGFGALLLLVLIKPWGLSLTWQQLSYATLTLVAIWLFMAVRAKREYIKSFRRSLEQHDVAPADIRTTASDLQTIETLVEELAHPDERRVLYAIDLLESLEKRNLITPLLLHHVSATVRARTLRSLQALRPEVARKWVPAIERLLTDEDQDVRAGAVRAISAIRGQEATGLMRPYLGDPNPRIAVTAAVALAASGDGGDVDAAYGMMQGLIKDPREGTAPTRREVARALAHIKNPRFAELLVPLMYDPSLDVARAAIQAAGGLAGSGFPVPGSQFLFVPALVSLLRNRLLKADARSVLVGYGTDIIDSLAYFLKDQDEDLWVRRHLPATLALIPGDASIAVLMGALTDRDGFIRYKAVVALDRIHRARPDLTIPREPIEAMVLAETIRHANALTLHYNLFVAGGLARDVLLARALEEKLTRSRNRIFHLLGLIYPHGDIDAARFAIEHGDTRARAAALEYLDNLLAGELRRRVMLLIEEMPADARVRKANVIFRTRVRDAEDTLAQLIHDEDQIIAAAAIHMTAERGIWKLADDLEHALAHRDVRDWYVFEAASWALAARRMAPTERRQRWLEPLPAVELADRLRRMPLFDYVSVDELFRVAGTGRQVRHEPGRTLFQSGVQPETLQFLIDGEVTVGSADSLPEQRPAPAALAFEEMLGGTPMRADVRATDVAITLSLTREEFLTLLSDNIDLAHGLFKMLLDTRAGAMWRRVMPGRIPAEIARLAEDGLQPIERVLLLQTSPLLVRATGEQLLRLASIAREVSVAQGAVLFGETDNPAIYALLSAVLTIEAAGEAPITANPGDAVGLYETLAGVPAGATMRVTKAGKALRLDGADLFDLLADNIDLLQGLFSALLRAQPAGAPVST